MTEPLTTTSPFPSPSVPTPPPDLEFPLGWLLDVAPPPVQYRASIEIAKLPVRDGELARLLFAYEPLLRLAVMQHPDGTWHRSILSIPSGRGDSFAGVGTVPAVLRLLEYGLEKDTPPLTQARRILFRLLAEDDDPSFAFELIPKGKPDPLIAGHARSVIREAAAATLARAGYEADPRLRGAATRLVDRVDAFLRSPFAEKPFIRVGNQHVLAPEAHPPSFHLMVMLAHMPLFRNERYDTLERLQHYLSQPVPRPTPAVSLGKKIVEMPNLLLGDPLPHRTAADADMPWSLVWLELAARLGFLRMNENWLRLFERLLDDRNADGVWTDPKRTVKMQSANPLSWPWFPLAENASDEQLSTEVTFRLGLIGKYAGRTIVVR